MYSFSPYELTLEKLDLIISSLKESIQTSDYQKAEPLVATLRDYASCFYCIAYRKNMITREKGVCDDCPIHKFGEKQLGRKIAVNGCYKTTFYKEMVRLSWWYRDNKSRESAQDLIEAINATKNHLTQNKSLADAIAYRDM